MILSQSLLDQILKLANEAGKHSVEYHYTTPYLIEGSMISFASIVFIILILLTRRKKTDDSSETSVFVFIDYLAASKRRATSSQFTTFQNAEM